MTDGQDVRALLKSIGGLKRRVAEMDRQVEQMRAMNAGAYAEELGRLAEGLRAEYAHALALIEACRMRPGVRCWNCAICPG